MTTSLVIGSDESVLEGIAQALAAAGHRAHVARSIAEASAVLTEIRPVVLLVERGCAAEPEFVRLRLPPGCALVLYRSNEEPTPALPTSVQRLTLADLILPWERQRMVTMIQRLTERAVATGRTRRDTPPEDRAV
jgi:NAD(P)-dependent dehydrogenase (short-subunit alcohol dehydrogenase family)